MHVLVCCGFECIVLRFLCSVVVTEKHFFFRSISSRVGGKERRKEGAWEGEREANDELAIAGCGGWPNRAESLPTSPRIMSVYGERCPRLEPTYLSLAATKINGRRFRAC